MLTEPVWKHALAALRSQEDRELASIVHVLGDADIRTNRVAAVKDAIVHGTYRVPARILAAHLMLEMLQ